MLYGICACDLNGGIGKDNALPWRSKSELQQFACVTHDYDLIMGAKTFQSLPVALERRHIHVLTSQDKFDLSQGPKGQSCSVLNLSEIDKIKFFQKNLTDHAFVCGGAMTYDLFKDWYDGFFLTLILDIYDCDTRLSLFKSLMNKTEQFRNFTQIRIAKSGKDDIPQWQQFFLF